ncbi:alpha/beta hydrolase [Streptomyces sp. NPDC004647]|uniref:alpha/beta hydrolase n=1 Tax=Streptomyces sp. NPDC004647 TaxID=3154671 RepID=UPI0033A23969
MASALGHAPVPCDAVVAYGEHPDQVVDLYAPRGGEGPAPLVVLLHGGAWRAPYDRGHVSPFAAHLAGYGFAVASVEYRRGQARSRPEPSGSVPRAGRWPETLDDVALALDRIPELVGSGPCGRVDPARVVITGHSAGGQLALWAAARHRLPADSPWYRASPPPVLGVVALAPIADFAAARRLRVCSDAVVQFLGGPRHYAARRPYADPAALLPTGIATTIVQGATDADVPPEVALAFAEAAGKTGAQGEQGGQGGQTRLVLLDGVGHFPLIDPVAPAARTVAEEIGRLTRRATP